MKKNVIILVFIFVILFLVLCGQFAYQVDRTYKVNEYENDNYELSDIEKQILSNRLENTLFFDKYGKYIEQYAEIRLSNDKKDGKAWGTISLVIDKKIEEEIKKILQETNEIIDSDSRVYGIIDEYGSIYIEKKYYYNKNEKIYLVFSVKLPYKYKSANDYNDFVRFFLKFNNK